VGVSGVLVVGSGQAGRYGGVCGVGVGGECVVGWEGVDKCVWKGVGAVCVWWGVCSGACRCCSQSRVVERRTRYGVILLVLQNRMFIAGRC